MRTRLPLAAIPLALLSGLAGADVLDPAVVDGRAQVLIHLDVDALLRTRLWRGAQEQRGAPVQVSLADFEAETGLDPLEDVRSVTVYSTGVDSERWVALLRTTEKLDAAVAMLAERPGYARLEVHGKTLHALEDDGRTWYGHVFRLPDASARLFAITEDQDAMLDAIGVVEGRRENVGKASEPAVASRPASGAVLFLSAARRLDEIGRFEPAAEVSRLLRGVVIEGGETGEEFFLQVRLNTASHDDALSVQQVAQGLIALGSLVASRGPEAPFHGELVRALRVDRTGTVVTLSFRVQVDLLLEKVRAAHAGHDR